MKLHRDLGVTQKTAWHLAHRIRRSLEAKQEHFAGPVEVDETYMGGKRKNMPKAKRNLLIHDTPHVRLYGLNVFRMRGSRLWGSRLHRACVV